MGKGRGTPVCSVNPSCRSHTGPLSTAGLAPEAVAVAVAVLKSSGQTSAVCCSKARCSNLSNKPKILTAEGSVPVRSFPLQAFWLVDVPLPRPGAHVECQAVHNDCRTLGETGFSALAQY